MKKNKVICIGSEGLAKQVLKHLNSTKFSNDTINGINCDYWFFDDVNKNPNDHDHNVITSINALEELCDKEFFTHYIILIGYPAHRKHFDEYLSAYNIEPINVISPTSEISGNHGNGCIILDQSLIEPDAVIGKQVLMNVGAKVFHDSTVGDYTELMPGCLILGNATIGSKCRIGANATILPNITICDNVVIGAGAVVTNNISYQGTYVGVPAKNL